MMFSDFQKAFLRKDEIDELIPEEIIKSLSEKLPSGFGYKGVGNGACGITTTSQKLNIGMKVEVPDDLLKEFKPATAEELLEFIYRTQSQLKVIPDEEGCITLNEIKFKVNDMIKFPLDNKIMVGTELYICPEPFQPPFKLSIEGGGVSKDISIQRQPYADMNKSYFKNVDDNILEISYILDKKKKTIKFTFKINIEKSNNTKEIIEYLKLYESYLKGEIKFAGIKFLKPLNEDKAIKKTIEFWERIFQLERKLDVQFLVQFPITIDDGIWIEKLYKSFIEEKPYKQYINIDKITVRGVKKYNETDITNKEGLSFQFVQNSELEIWGVKLNMYDSIGLFDLMVSDIVLVNKDNEEYELLVEPTTSKGIYQSIRHFTKEEEAKNYKGKELQNAELITVD